jgi:hypothetical protein
MGTMAEAQMGELAPLPVRGVGFFLRRMGQATIERRVQRMVDHGVTFVAVGTIWQDIDRRTREPVTRWVNRPEVARLIVDACVAAGLNVLLWGYPMRGRECEFVSALRRCSTPDVLGVVPDPELRSKATDDDHDGEVGAAEMLVAFNDAKTLFWEVVKANPYWYVFITSYGLARGHPTMPWKAFFDPDAEGSLVEAAAAMPQLYDQPLAHMCAGMEQYKALGADRIIPAFGTYKFARDESGKRITPRMSGPELDEHLGALMSLRGEFGFDAMIGWSESQVSGAGWKIIEKYAGMF